jgi:formylglycine-generating enzyme required for sulfatase activity
MRNALSATLIMSVASMLAAVPASSLMAQPPVTPPLVLPPAPAGVEITTEHGIEFATVNLRNNPSFRPNGYDGPPADSVPYGRGSVAEPFRISRVELTARQFEPFAQAFWPLFISQTSTPNHGGVFQYQSFAGGPTTGPMPSYENHPIPMSMDIALRYCNWLHNGAPANPLTRDAFDSGAYDLREIPVGAGGALSHVNPRRQVGARFFLPDYDQWLAASFYDPNRSDPVTGRYWVYPNRSDAPPVPTWADPVNATLYVGPLTPEYPVASFPTQQSAWGLFDVAGGNSEWLDGTDSAGPVYNPRAIGFSSQRGINGVVSPLFTAINYGINVQPFSDATTTGIRIAAVVPSPSAATILMGVIYVLPRRIRL